MSNARPSLRARIKAWTPPIRTQRILALLLLIAQGGITVTGSTVRVTGSGLACDTWPNCHPGSLVPVPGAAPMVQQMIEFCNRLLTFVLVAFAIAVVWALYAARRRSELKVYAWLNIAGIVVQAVVGGVSVWLDLKWWAVALHFLPSVLLVWLAAMLYVRIVEPDDGLVKKLYPSSARTLILLAAIALTCVLVTGTMVTGSGPHPGDWNLVEGRLAVDTITMTYIHAACLYVYLIFTLVAAVVLFRSTDPVAPKESRSIARFLLLLIVVQWGIGVAQFHLGVPSWTVPIHIGMSSVVTGFSGVLWAQGKRRSGKETIGPITGSPEGDMKHEQYSELISTKN